VLIPATQSQFHNGAIGAAISLVLTEVIMDGVGMVLVGRRVFTSSSFRRCTLATLACAGMWGAAYAAAPLGTMPSLLAGGLVLILLIIVLRIPNSEERALIRSGLTRLQRRTTRGEAEAQTT
jgi:hypothetical protein